MPYALLFISGTEIIFIFFAILLLFGADKIPEVARWMGKGMKEFKKVTNDLKKEFEEETKEIKQIKKDIEEDIDITGEMRNFAENSELGKDVKEIRDNLNK